MLPLRLIKNSAIFARMEQVLPALPDSCVDLTVTSPPYKDEDGYSPKLMMALFRELYRAHKDGSYMFVNFGHLVAFKERPFWLVLVATKFNWKLHETIVWEKPQFTPSTSDYNVNNLYEFVFMFRKGDPVPLNRLSIGVPYKDKSNVRRYGRGADLRCGGNIWRFGYDTIQRAHQKLHPHRFPDELPERCIKLVGLSSGLVCDPFGGSFTTAAVARKRGLDFVSCDCSLFNALSASYNRGIPFLNLSTGA